MLRNLINRTDIGMVQGRCCAGLPAEAFQNLRVLGNVVRQKFQGDETTEHRILGLVDDTHAPAAQLLDDAVVRDGLADHWRESYVCETGKSMKAVELALSQKGCLAKNRLIDQESQLFWFFVLQIMDGLCQLSQSTRLDRVFSILEV